jgi:hypothetical protein
MRYEPPADERDPMDEPEPPADLFTPVVDWAEFCRRAHARPLPLRALDDIAHAEEIVERAEKIVEEFERGLWR